MATETQDQTEEQAVVQKKATENSDVESLREYLDSPKAGPEETPEAEETPDKTEESSEEKETGKPKEPAEPQRDFPLGTSLAMEQAARQAGVPDQLIEFARDDEQLSHLAQMAGQRSPEKKKPGYKVELPEEEFEQDNPVRKALTGLHDHYGSEFKQLSQNMSELVQVVQTMQQSQNTQQEGVLAQEQAAFDDEMSQMESEALGNGELTEGQHGLRGHIFETVYAKMRADNPGGDIRETARVAAKQILPHLLEKQKAESTNKVLQRQSRTRLGGGNSKPATEKPKSEIENMQAFLDKIGVKRPL